MYLKSNIDVGEFLIAVQRCEGNVFFETKEGDRLNLSSTLSQFIFCTVSGQSYDWRQGKIRLTKPEDLKHLSSYLEVPC